MHSQAPIIEWMIVENDMDWERLHTAALLDGAPDASRCVRLGHYPWGGVILLLLLVGVGGWWWRIEQDGLLQAKAALVMPDLPNPFVSSALREPADVAWWRQHGREARELRTTIQASEPDTAPDAPLHTIHVQGDRAMASVLLYTAYGQVAHRQTRFYQRTQEGWQQTQPDVTLWGPERSLETAYFVYHFRQNDAGAVIAISAQMDALYQTMRRNFGLSGAPGAEKLLIDVSVTQTSGYASVWFGAPYRIHAPSPAIFVAPVDLTDAELLAQSIAFPLLDQVLMETRAQFAVREAWQPVLYGLSLWQLWDGDLPLSVWRDDVVTWLYLHRPGADAGQDIMLPERYRALCAAHQLWLPAPYWRGIPLFCIDRDQEEWLFKAVSPRDALVRLDQLAPLIPPSENVAWSYSYAPHPGHTVALATLIEYAVITYGRERLPVLVAGLGQHADWETLVPAVFGVSATEFEAGWQAHLESSYGAP